VKQQTKRGLIFGLIGTVVMSILMLIGKVTGISPIPEPIPIVIMKHILGDIAKPILMISGMMSHLIYGSMAGAVFYSLIKNRGNIYRSMGFGILLWLIMQLTVLPFLGWGIFGSAITPKIAIATLVLHLVYGVILGLGFPRKQSQIK